MGDPQRAVAAGSKLGYFDSVLGHVAEFLAWLDILEAEDANSITVSSLRRPVMEMQTLAYMGRRWLTVRPIATEMKDACDSLKLSVEAEPEDEEDPESRPEPKPFSEYHNLIKGCLPLIVVTATVMLTGSWASSLQI